jgi:hypothetical protein
MPNYHVYSFKNSVEKIKGLILLCCEKTLITQWDILVETPSAYFISLTSLYKNPCDKN